ncbi:type II secretion system F family protein [Naasia sp. SYSU D00948]|uniref:type II secretion system F family protein n=1 Tax=Naasia sp. SYSU D00948 TaxID=2817379 RepID=UPI0027DDEFA4|nr:type II secretion system F family protein [Naasia sp. SYSU D00948]
MVPVTGVGWALVLGAFLGLGLWTLASAVPRIGAPRLAQRLAPHLVDVSAEARRLVARRPSDPLPLLGQLGAPLIEALRQALDRVLGGRDTLLWRIRAAGLDLTVERYRSQQLLALLLGTAAGGVPTMLLLGAPPGVRLALPLLGAAIGLFGRDHLLGRAARRRLQRMREELPTVLEFLVLSLSAGEGLQDAIRRVSRIGSGAVAKELAVVMAEVGSGVPLATALGRMSRELRLPPLSRAVDHLIAALERGSPLAEVLRAQAEDCRNEARRILLESAGRKEIAMLVPLVFLILPTTVVIAIFPGLLVLQTGF